MRTFVAWFLALVLAVVLLFVATAPPSHAQELTTPDQVLAYIDAYSWQYATEAWPHDALAARATRVVNCESDHLDMAVINNVRLGRLGEVGSFQFLPGPHSIFWQTPSAAAGWDYYDPEANVAAAIFLISRGHGRDWSCW